MTDVERALRVERRIAAPPSVVFAYLTDGAKWARWQGATAEVEPVPGGRFRMTMPSGLVAEGRFLEVVPDRLVRFSWGWAGHPTVPPGSTTVAIELVADGAGTLLTLTHSGLPPDEQAVHLGGWDHYLPRLAAASEGRDPGVDPGP